MFQKGYILLRFQQKDESEEEQAGAAKWLEKRAAVITCTEDRQRIAAVLALADSLLSLGKLQPASTALFQKHINLPTKRLNLAAKSYTKQLKKKNLQIKIILKNNVNSCSFK